MAAMAIHGRSSESFEVFLCFSKSQSVAQWGESKVSRKKEALRGKVGWVSDCLTALSYLSPFDEVGDHHNGPDPLLPDHAPERVKGVGEWALRGHIRPRLLEPVDEVGIEVLATLLAGKGPKLDARVIV